MEDNNSFFSIPYLESVYKPLFFILVIPEVCNRVSGSSVKRLHLNVAKPGGWDRKKPLQCNWILEKSVCCSNSPWVKSRATRKCYAKAALRAREKITSHSHISSSARLWLLLNHKILKITCYSCGFAQSDQPNPTTNLSAKNVNLFFREP